MAQLSAHFCRASLENLRCPVVYLKPAEDARSGIFSMESSEDRYVKTWSLRCCGRLSPSAGDLLWERARYPWQFGGDQNWDNVTSYIPADVYCSHATHSVLRRMVYDGRELRAPSKEESADWDAYLASVYINLKSRSWCCDSKQKGYSISQFCRTFTVAGVLTSVRCDYPDPSLGALCYRFAGPRVTLKIPADSLVNMECEDELATSPGPSDFNSWATSTRFSPISDVPKRCYDRSVGMDLHLLVCRAYHQGHSHPRFVFRFLVSATLTSRGLLNRAADLLEYAGPSETVEGEGFAQLTDHQTLAVCYLGHRRAVPVSERFFDQDPQDADSYLLKEFELAADRSWLLY